MTLNAAPSYSQLQPTWSYESRGYSQLQPATASSAVRAPEPRRAASNYGWLGHMSHRPTASYSQLQLAMR
eukprot:569323-Alexandrium_andersonii.AAC.1